MCTLNQAQLVFYTWVQPASKGGLNPHLSEFEMLENDRLQMNVNRLGNGSSAECIEVPIELKCSVRMYDSFLTHTLY